MTETSGDATDNYADTIIDGKYRCERKIGEGGMGVVYAGTHVLVGRKIAIKLLHPRYSHDRDLRARFEVEAKAIAKLNHPNCITLYDFGYSEDLSAFYTIVEFIDGTPLNRAIGRDKPLASVAQSVAIIKQIAAGLEHAHLHGILHRDLKPENVMLARTIEGNDVAKVLDFGIAQIVKGTYAPSSDSQRLTKEGDVFGTPQYMSPEQAYGDRKLTPACDFYALGVMFYELLEGRLPFEGTTPLEFLIKHAQKPPSPITRHDVPEALRTLVQQMLDKDPLNRPQSGRELIRVLDRLDITLDMTLKEYDLRAYQPTLGTAELNALEAPTETFPHGPTLPGGAIVSPIRRDTSKTTQRLGLSTAAGKRRQLGIGAALLAIIAILVVGNMIFQRSDELDVMDLHASGTELVEVAEIELEKDQPGQGELPTASVEGVRDTVEAVRGGEQQGGIDAPPGALDDNIPTTPAIKRDAPVREVRRHKAPPVSPSKPTREPSTNKMPPGVSVHESNAPQDVQNNTEMIPAKDSVDTLERPAAQDELDDSMFRPVKLGL